MPIADEASPPNQVMLRTETTYYSGSAAKQTAQINENGSIELGPTAADPAFEKAWRAMAILAQGRYGTPSGLQGNQDRIGAALYLIDSAIEHDPSKAPPHGDERVSDIRSVARSIGLGRALIDRVTESQRTMVAVLQTGAGEIEDIDPLATIVQLLDDQRSLEASYQVLSRVREMSLVNYLR
jgi:flagellin-like hook-associated protein FlgL